MKPSATQADVGTDASRRKLGLKLRLTNSHTRVGRAELLVERRVGQTDLTQHPPSNERSGRSDGSKRRSASSAGIELTDAGGD